MVLSLLKDVSLRRTTSLSQPAISSEDNEAPVVTFHNHFATNTVKSTR